MRPFWSFAAAVLLCAWAAQPVAAQSALKRLEELIRGQRPAEAAKQPAEAQGPRQPIEQPAVAPAAVRGYLGLVADDRQDRGRGVRILEVRPGSPAESAGLKPQDLITTTGGVRVRQMDDLADVLDQTAPGEVLEFEILRGEDARKIQVTMGFPPQLRADALEELHTPKPEAEDRMPRVEDLDQAAPALLPPPQEAAKRKPIEAGPGRPPEDINALLEALRRRIDQLERRVEELEQRLGEAK